METVLTFNDENFDDLFLVNPTRLQGGAYFSKLFLEENKPVVFQTPKSSTKNGLIMTSKKTYCDLLFTADDQKFVQWIENFEQAIQFLIYQKRNLWFHNDMDLEDIEYFFNPSIRLYNKNKYLLRCYIHQPKHIKNADVDLQIYDEHENILTVQDVKKDQKIISILEVLGIKFTSQSFNIDYCLRQIMIIDEKPLFNKCLINAKRVMKKKEVELPKLNDDEVNDDEVNEDKVNETDQIKNAKVTLIVNDCSNNIQEKDASDNIQEKDASDNIQEKDVSDNIQEKNTNIQENIKLEEEQPKENIKEEVAAEMKDIQISLDDSENTDILEKFKDEIKKEEHLENSLKEIDICKMKTDEIITLKKPTEVYLKIYKEARKKAKKARKIAIQAFLEAKRIKNTYLVGDIESDDSNSDNEELFSEQF